MGVKIVLYVALFLIMLLGIAHFIKFRLEGNQKKTLKSFLNHLRPKSPLDWAIYLFLTVSFCSVLFSINPYHSQRILFERYIPYMLFFAFGCFLAKRFNNTTYLIFIFSGIILCCGGILDHSHYPQNRLFTSFGRGVTLSNFLIFIFPLSCIVSFFANNKFLRFAGLLAILMSFPCLIWNQSRAAWIAVPIAILGIGLLKNNKKFISLLVILGLVVFFLPLKYKVRAEATFDISSWNRVELYQTALKIFKKYPVFGSGLGMFEKLANSKSFAPINGYPDCPIHFHVHNIYLEVLSEMGIIGLLVFLGIFATFFKAILSAKTILEKVGNDQSIFLIGLSGSILATLIFAMASSIILIGMQDAALFWFSFGVANGLLSVISADKPVLQVNDAV